MSGGKTTCNMQENVLGCDIVPWLKTDRGPRVKYTTSGREVDGGNSDGDWDIMYSKMHMQKCKSIAGKLDMTISIYISSLQDMWVCIPPGSKNCGTAHDQSFLRKAMQKPFGCHKYIILYMYIHIYITYMLLGNYNFCQAENAEETYSIQTTK